MIWPGFGGDHPRQFPTPIGGSGLQAIVNVVGQDAHILHYPFGMAKYLGVNALQHELRLPGIIQPNEKRVVDIAIAKGFYANNAAFVGKLVSDVKNISRLRRSVRHVGKLADYP